MYSTFSQKVAATSFQNCFSKVKKHTKTTTKAAGTTSYIFINVILLLLPLFPVDQDQGWWTAPLTLGQHLYGNGVAIHSPVEVDHALHKHLQHSNNNKRLFTAPHFVRAQSAYKYLTIHSFHHRHTYQDTHTHTKTHTHIPRHPCARTHNAHTLQIHALLVMDW